MSYSSTRSLPVGGHSRDRAVRPTRSVLFHAVGFLLGLCSALVILALPRASLAQDWGEEDDVWTRSEASASDPIGGPMPTGWSLRAGIGFIHDPTALLLNFEAPYAFDQWVSAGPMLQVGLDDNNTIVAPSLNVSVTIPDLPGEDFDRFHPFGFVGIGFAYIEDDNRRNDNSSTGFLVNFGVGLEYQLSDNFFLGSQMIFNFLPEETLDEYFFFSWQIGGARITF